MGHSNRFKYLQLFGVAIKLFKSIHFLLFLIIKPKDSTNTWGVHQKKKSSFTESINLRVYFSDVFLILFSDQNTMLERRILELESECEELHKRERANEE